MAILAECRPLFLKLHAMAAPLAAATPQQAFALIVQEVPEGIAKLPASASLMSGLWAAE